MTRQRWSSIVALVAGALALLVWGSAQAACEPDKAAAKYPGLAGKTLKVGLDPTLPPVMYRDPKEPAKIVGQDPDMVDAAMKCLGLKYALVALDFGTLVPTLQADQIQLIWSNIYYTPERAKVADFVTYADRKSTRLNSSHITISYAVFCLKKKKKKKKTKTNKNKTTITTNKHT